MHAIPSTIVPFVGPEVAWRICGVVPFRLATENTEGISDCNIVLCSMSQMSLCALWLNSSYRLKARLRSVCLLAVTHRPKR